VCGGVCVVCVCGVCVCVGCVCVCARVRCVLCVCVFLMKNIVAEFKMCNYKIVCVWVTVAGC